MSVLSLIPEERKRYFPRRESTESVYSSGSKVSCISKRKLGHPIIGTSRMLASSHSFSSSRSDKHITQRVLSAKMLRVKQLQNQLADAHITLTELQNENKLLRAIQKKQDTALQRYENSNAELPKMLSSHSEEIRILQSRCKQLKQQYKEVSVKLKEKETELQQLKDEHKHIINLSKDKKLLEREKLQAQVGELTEKMQKQNETIFMLQRKITLEAKNYRYQLHSEITKHKDTQNDLDLAITNADKLSSIIEMKEKVINNNLPKRPGKMSSIPIIRPQSKVSLKQGAGDTVGLGKYIYYESTDSDHTLPALYSNSKHGELKVRITGQSDMNIAQPEQAQVTYIYNHAQLKKVSTTRTISKDSTRDSASSEMSKELASTIQAGMADMNIFDNRLGVEASSQDDIQRKIEEMKSELKSKLKIIDGRKDNRPSLSGSTSATISRKSAEIHSRCSPDSAATDQESSGYNNIDENTAIVIRSNSAQSEVDYDSSVKQTADLSDKKRGEIEKLGKSWQMDVEPVKNNENEKVFNNYCQGIMKDIAKSTEMIDKHMKEFASSKMESEKLAQHLQVLDKMSELVNSNEIDEYISEGLVEMNNNHKTLSRINSREGDKKKGSLSGRRSIMPSREGSISDAESRKSTKIRSDVNFDDSNLSNQDLLNDLLGNK